MLLSEARTLRHRRLLVCWVVVFGGGVGCCVSRVDWRGDVI